MRSAPTSRPGLRMAPRNAAVWLRYFVAAWRGRPAGEYSYTPSPRTSAPLEVEIKLLAEGPDAVDQQAAAAWCAKQTLPTLSAVGYRATGEPAWRVGQASDSHQGSQAPAWFMAPKTLPEVYPAFVESAVLVAAAEEVDAVVLTERLEQPAIESPADLLQDTGRTWTLFDALAYAWDPGSNTVRSTGSPKTHQRVKFIDDNLGDTSRETQTFHRFRRGPYLSSRPLPPRLQIGIRSLPVNKPRTNNPVSANRQGLLVTVPFLARGGAEHTIFETLNALKDEFDISIVTLAPHRPELGDRRADFHQVTERIYCLGDLVHPAAMPAILDWLLAHLNIDILYNANSTTLFYDFGPALKANRPGLRVLDHLYDHRVGYIERYEDPNLRQWIDACVAENRRIARVLVEERGWTPETAPVVWPCGRAPNDFPTDTETVRRDLRRQLGLDDDDLVILTAARMHPQKRPFDLVALAERVRDLADVCFLLVGGGDLEGEVDDAIASLEQTSPSRIRRLAFRTDIPHLIAAADIGCLVSEYEGLPVFMLECFQLGRPFLGTDVGDMGTVLRETGAGLVVDTPGDLDTLEAQVRLLHDPTTRRELARLAAAAAKQFDVKTCARRYAKVFYGNVFRHP